MRQPLDDRGRMVLADGAETGLCLCAQIQIMGTKTIGITDEVYARLKARKREGESFTELVDRLMEEARPDWRAGFGSLAEDEASELGRLVEEERAGLDRGLAGRQERTLDAMADDGAPDEAP